MFRSLSHTWLKGKTSLLVFLLAIVIGGSSFAYYYVNDLTTAHYDAKAHLLVARRLSDAIQPGYSQLGIHWLPLTHLLYWPLTLSETQYRTGFLPSLLSVLAFSVSVWLIYRIALRITGSYSAGVFGAGFLAANANLQYLQSCPLTEPLYMALSLLALDAFISWREAETTLLPWRAAIWTALAGLCRYEGWYFVAGILALLGWDFLRENRPRAAVFLAALLFAGVFALPTLMHFGYIYYTVGDSFLHRVVRGNPAPFETFRRPFLSSVYHLGELTEMAAIIPLIVGLTGTVYCLVRPLSVGRRLPLFLLWLPSLMNISALYWGLIYRVRYSVLLLPALALFASLLVTKETAVRRTFVTASLAAMFLPWLSWFFPDEWVYRFFFQGPGILILPAASLTFFLWAQARGKFQWPLLALCVLGMQIPALLGEARPILDETLEHEFVEAERHKVLDYLNERYDGTRILIDIQRQAPLIYDSRLPVKEFVYNEGQRVFWDRALQSPPREVGWLCAENGDEVWQALQVDPPWLDRYSLAVKTESFLLYQLRREDRESLLPDRR